jgi:hypothetical protein
MRTAAKLADLELREDWAGLAAACRQRGIGVLFRGAPDGAAAEQAGVAPLWWTGQGWVVA